MRTFDHDGIALAYDVWGDDDAPPIVLLHGIMGARTTWFRVAPELATDHRVYAVDLRGHGATTRAPGTYDLEHWVGDVVAFLEQVVGGPAIVVGHSLGGVVTTAVIAARPDLVRGALLEDPPMFALTGQREWGDTSLANGISLVRSFLTHMRDKGAPVDEYVATARHVPALNGAGTMVDVLGEEGIAQYGRAWMDFDLAVYDDMAAAASSVGSTYDPERRLDVPLLVLQAEPDRAAAFHPQHATRFLAANPHAVIELVDGASHLVHDEQPALVVDRIRAFAAAHAT